MACESLHGAVMSLFAIYKIYYLRYGMGITLRTNKALLTI